MKLTPLGLGSILLALLSAISFGLAASSLNESGLTPAQLWTFKLSFYSLMLGAAFWLALEVYTLFFTKAEKDHISPAWQKMLQENKRFKIAFISGFAFLTSLAIHLLFRVRW